MQNILVRKLLSLTFLILFLSTSVNSFARIWGDDPKQADKRFDSVIGKEKLFFETEDINASEQIIRDHLLEIFPIISETEIIVIIKTKIIKEILPLISDSLTISNTIYKISFEVPKNYLADTAKILWELNIPEFQSRLYQIYNGEQLYIDTWPNVVGTIKDKTYTGNFQAYKIRNWPFYKDPDPSKAHLSPTKPGAGNPLGLFVVHYDENSLRYFHGTNQPGVLDNKLRNLSHGCVRNDNDNIAKMKEFIIKRVVKSKDLSNWLGSKKTVIYEFEETDKFPVRINYKTFEVSNDILGKYIILFKDVYNYRSGRINKELNDTALITLTNTENIFADYRKTFGNEIPDDALKLMINYVINKGVEYEKYYIDALKEKFMIQN